MPEFVASFGVSGGLIGIVTPAAREVAARRGTGVILLNAGVVHRVGPHRLYVGLARTLAQAGFTVLRFDHSGIGDSLPRPDQMPFEQSAVLETVDAMGLLSAQHGCERFILLGLCSGTLTAFKAAQQDPRVVGLVLLTALLQDPSTVPQATIAEASSRRVATSYRTEKLRSGRSWLRLLTGRADYRRVLAAARRLVATPARKAPDPGTAAVIGELDGLLRRGVSILFVYGEPTTVLEYFRMTLDPVLPRLQRAGQVSVTVFPGADHTFTRQHDQRRLIERVNTWLEGHVPH